MTKDVTICIQLKRVLRVTEEVGYCQLTINHNCVLFSVNVKYFVIVIQNRESVWLLPFKVNSKRELEIYSLPVRLFFFPQNKCDINELHNLDLNSFSESRRVSNFIHSGQYNQLLLWWYSGIFIFHSCMIISTSRQIIDCLYIYSQEMFNKFYYNFVWHHTTANPSAWSHKGFKYHKDLLALYKWVILPLIHICDVDILESIDR